MHPGTKTALAVVGGTVLAAWYFGQSEKGIPSESNCSYLSPWITDVAAWGAGATLIIIGHKNGSILTSFIGAAIATLHVAQFAAHKVITRPTAEEIMAGKIPVEDLSTVEQAGIFRALEEGAFL